MRIVLEAGACHNSKEYAKEVIAWLATQKMRYQAQAPDSGGKGLSLKVQMYQAGSLVVPGTARYDQTGGPARTQDELFDRALSYDDWREVFRAARLVEVDMFATPFDFEAIDVMVDMGMTECKIASGDITFHQLIARAAKRFDHIIISTGASYLDEIELAVKVAGEHGARVTLLACHLQYPTEVTSANLGRLDWLQTLGDTQPALQKVRFGYSDHTPGVETFVPLRVMGASMVEKHFTLERGTWGDDLFAATGGEIIAGIEAVKRTEAMLVGDQWVTSGEAAARVGARRSCVAAHSLSRGQTITADDIVFLRPGIGVAPCDVDMLIGRELAVDVAQGQAIQTAWLKPGGRGKATATLEVT